MGMVEFCSSMGQSRTCHLQDSYCGICASQIQIWELAVVGMMLCRRHRFWGSALAITVIRVGPASAPGLIVGFLGSIVETHMRNVAPAYTNFPHVGQEMSGVGDFFAQAHACMACARLELVQALMRVGHGHSSVAAPFTVCLCFFSSWRPCSSWASFELFAPSSMCAGRHRL
ncbi:unnamed protein product [Prorocentrum cordatum]|uniref:Uncharacterized protein n=1 Tax=Prorocentrum cordatum TaxID=2364126 RepID=A0ABN9UVQ6_9DINO|nr:unnamed protein product [Polarella glacialis]